MINKHSYLINYSLNKFCPYFMIALLMFYKSNFSPWKACFCLCLSFFIDKFSFKAGYSVAYCEANNIDLEDHD